MCPAGTLYPRPLRRSATEPRHRRVELETNLYSYPSSPHVLKAFLDSWNGIFTHVKNAIQIDEKCLHSGLNCGLI